MGLRFKRDQSLRRQQVGATLRPSLCGCLPVFARQTPRRFVCQTRFLSRRLARRPSSSVLPLWSLHCRYTGPGSDINGYNALRNDYDVEYDNDAELMLKDVEILGDEDDKEKELKTCLFRAFNRTR